MKTIRIHINPNCVITFAQSLPIDRLVTDTQRFFRQIKRLQEPPDTVPDERVICYALHSLKGLKRRFEGLESLAKALSGDTEIVYLAYKNQVEKHLNQLQKAV